MSLYRVEHTASVIDKIKLYIVYGKMFFLLIHLLELEEYELPKKLYYSALLTLECVRIIS